MAHVTIELTDTETGVLIKCNSDEPMPSDAECNGSIAENLALIGLFYIKQTYKEVVGKEPQKITLS